MQTGNLLEKTKRNCRFMTWLWHHHRHNHYSHDVIRVTKSSANLYLYYFIIKCNLFIKILQCGKNTKNMKFLQNYKFPNIFRCFQQNIHCRTSEGYRTLKNTQSMSNRYKLKVTKTQPHQFILSEIFQKVWVGGGGGSFRSLPPPPKVEMGLSPVKLNDIDWNILTRTYSFIITCIIL